MISAPTRETPTGTLRPREHLSHFQRLRVGAGASGRARGRGGSRRRRACGEGCASAKHTGDTAYTAAQVPHSPAKPTAERRVSVAASRPHSCTTREESSGPIALTWRRRGCSLGTGS